MSAKLLIVCDECGAEEASEDMEIGFDSMREYLVRKVWQVARMRLTTEDLCPACKLKPEPTHCRLCGCASNGGNVCALCQDDMLNGKLRVH